MTNTPDCYHCGSPANETPIQFEDKTFCCIGCKSVYEILTTNQLTGYYELNQKPGINQRKRGRDFSFLDGDQVKATLLSFSDQNISVVELFLPTIHCSSCIWLLENLRRIQPAVLQVKVNFPKRKAKITFDHTQLTLTQLAELLDQIGYAPHISLKDTDKTSTKEDTLAIRRLAVAGFAFGNIMLMALPEYFHGSAQSLQGFLPFFRWLMLILSLPVMFYSGWGYFESAYKGLKHKFINIDVPIVIGMLSLFLRSVYEMLSGIGSGYFDSLAGLLFFLLLGKWFQRKTYGSISFDRDYKSYFPIAITRKGEENESVPVQEIKKGDRVIIRQNEVIPVDGILIKGTGILDNSFVTGESTPVRKKEGDKIFAGGRQTGGMIELEVTQPVNQSYLTQLWNEENYDNPNQVFFQNITDRISQHFTLIVLALATIAALFWWRESAGLAINVFTAILIVACPCALALAAPFALGNALRLLSKKGFFAKNTDTLELFYYLNYVVFDKTGTLTYSDKQEIKFHGQPLSENLEGLIKSTTFQSTHPLSQALCNRFQKHQNTTPTVFNESPGKGIEATFANGDMIKLGAANFVSAPSSVSPLSGDAKTAVHLEYNQAYLGYFSFEHQYRNGLENILKDFKKDFEMAVLTGDNEGEKENLQQLFPPQTELNFNQQPEDKYQFIVQKQKEGKTIMMIGDGLNDAGALKKSDIGISLTENIHSFSPACDVILDAQSFSKLPKYITFLKKTRIIIQWAFGLSFAYNLVGLAFAAMGVLSPVVSAILMPVSSITMVIFVMSLTNRLGKKLL